MKKIPLFLGDKIIGINGVSIEGMPYDRAMSLLRDNEKPKLQLTLLKNALYKGKGMYVLRRYYGECRVLVINNLFCTIMDLSYHSYLL